MKGEGTGTLMEAAGKAQTNAARVTDESFNATGPVPITHTTMKVKFQANAGPGSNQVIVVKHE
jgi:hypothetical protein